MSLDFIASLTNGALARTLFSSVDPERSPTPNTALPWAVSQSGPDGVELSERARAAYEADATQPGGAGDFEYRFKQALVKFTEFALELNGMPVEAKGKQIVMALNLLAEKSGVRLPGNLNEGKEDWLAEFQSKWGLNSEASDEEILQTMKRVYGDGPSLVTDEKEGPALRPQFPDGTGSVQEGVSKVPQGFHKTLSVFMARLFEQKGITFEPGEREMDRMLQLLAGKLGVTETRDGLARDVAYALGVTKDSSPSEILDALVRAYET